MHQVLEYPNGTSLEIEIKFREKLGKLPTKLSSSQPLHSSVLQITGCTICGEAHVVDLCFVLNYIFCILFFHFLLNVALCIYDDFSVIYSIFLHPSIFIKLFLKSSLGNCFSLTAFKTK